MNKLFPLILITILVFVHGSNADAEMYKYRDENGKLRFTDDRTKVPEKYRKGSQKKAVYTTPVVKSNINLKVYKNTCQPSKHEYTALHAAARKNNISEAKLLILNGANMEAQDPTCLTPLHIAASENKLEMVELLLSKGANANVTSSGGWAMPLTSAITINKIEIVELLIKNGADVNATTVRNTKTPLMYASDFGRIPIVQFLIANGADVNFRNSKGLTALGIALEKGNKKIAKILSQHGAK